MKRAWNYVTEIIKNEDYTTREAVLSGIVLFLAGIIIGSVLSPKRELKIGSNNGNNNRGNVENPSTQTAKEDAECKAN